MSSRLSLPSPSISVNVKNDQQLLVSPSAPYEENKSPDEKSLYEENNKNNIPPQPQQEEQQPKVSKCKCKCKFVCLWMPDCDCWKCLMPDCDCCNCCNCLCAPEWRKFAYPWSTFCGLVALALYICAFTIPWLVGSSDGVPCYTIGTYGEFCEICCPWNVTSSGAILETPGVTSDATFILILTLPVFLLSAISFFFTTWGCSSRKNIICWWCCCCCHNNACNVDCCQISETTYNCCDTIQGLSILIRFTTTFLTISMLYMFQTNVFLPQINNPTYSPYNIQQPGMIIASVALCFDFVTAILLSLDLWDRKNIVKIF